MQDHEAKGQSIKKDGLTKKERRALKVSAKGLEVKSEEFKNNLKVLNSSGSNVNEIQKENNKIQVQTENVHNIEKYIEGTKNDIQQKSVTDGLSKTELRAQRRAIQEAQRLAKQQKTAVADKPSVPKEKAKDEEKPPVAQKSKSEEKSKLEFPQKSAQSKVAKVQLFSHLEVATKDKSSIVVHKVHPAFVRLGTQYSHKTILGSNARCLALLSTLKSLVSNFEAPQNQEFCRSLEVTLQSCVQYLQRCRPLAVSMTNALRYFKLLLAGVNVNLPESEKRDTLIKCIEDYTIDEIEKAGEAISMKVQEKISNGDVILTYGCSSLVLRILLEAHTKSKKQFGVIVVDSNPLFEGKEMLRRLVNAGIECTYVLIHATSFIMSKATKVFLGAHALLANGYVMSRIGTAQIALIAKTFSKPVLVCCETYKFCERVQTDSIVYNELGYPGELLRTTEKDQQLDTSNSKLTLLNLMYDVTPPDLVTVVATELAFLPCTSVPVILRIDLEKTKK